MKYKGQVVWITGATAGLGREMAYEFARQGAYVIPSGRREQRLLDVCSHIEAITKATTDAALPASLGIALDVTQEETLQSAVDRIIATYGRLDIVVANAGFGVSGAIGSLSTDDWRRQFNVNVIGLVSTVTVALPHLRDTQGRIGLVSSVMGCLTMPRNGAYSASKYAVRAIGQTLSMELHGTGVSCTTIFPGFVESEIGQVNNLGEHDPDTRDKRPAGLMWPTAKAARIMVGAIGRRKRNFTFTTHGKIGAWFGRHMPDLIHILMRRRHPRSAQ